MSKSRSVTHRKPAHRKPGRNRRLTMTAFAGYGGNRKPKFRKETLMERGEKLLKTMNDPDKTGALRKAARKTLAELISAEEKHIKEDRTQLFQGRTIKELQKEELIELSFLELNAAELDVITARFNGEKPESEGMKFLTKRLNNLRTRRTSPLG